MRFESKSAFFRRLLSHFAADAFLIRSSAVQVHGDQMAAILYFLIESIHAWGSTACFGRV
jgi:hypothetical protein